MPASRASINKILSFGETCDRAYSLSPGLQNRSKSCEIGGPVNTRGNFARAGLTPSLSRSGFCTTMRGICAARARAREPSFYCHQSSGKTTRSHIYLTSHRARYIRPDKSSSSARDIACERAPLAQYTRFIHINANLCHRASSLRELVVRGTFYPVESRQWFAVSALHLGAPQRRPCR